MFLQCKFNIFFTLPQRYGTSCPFSATKMAPNVDGAGEIGVSATKKAKNVDGAGENGGSATKTAKNVDGGDARSMPGMTPYHL